MINLFVNHYTDQNSKRNEELLHCLKMNINNALIDNVIVLCNNEGDNEMLNNKKVSILLLKGRPTYNVFFQVIEKYTKSEDVNIIINSDIYLDSTLKYLFKYIRNKTLIALTRWDVKGNELRFLNRSDSQDTWIFKGTPKVDCNFYMGQPGCDNVLADRFHKAGYICINPSRTIRTIHVHETEQRYYTHENKLPPPYKLLQPTG